MPTKREWCAVLYVGDPDRTVRARFPRAVVGSRRDCEAALERWSKRAGHQAQLAIAACNVKIGGPYPSRRAARAADISG